MSEPLAGQPSDVPAVPLDEPAPSPQTPPADPLGPFLVPNDPTATSGSFMVWAAYAHGGRWLKESETTACAW